MNIQSPRFIRNHRFITAILIVNLVLLVLFFLTQGVLFIALSFLFFFFLSITIGALLIIKTSSMIDRNVEKSAITQDQAIRHKKIITCLIVLLIILMGFLSFLIYPWVIPNVKGAINEGYLHEIVNELTKGEITDQEKIGAVLEWFDGNNNHVHNAWILINKEKKVVWTVADDFFYILSDEPYVYIRIKENIDPKWFLTNRCGACDEYSRIFMVMVDALGYNVRRVHAPGEDHVWNEVEIDGEWIPVDPTNVSLPEADGWEHYGFFEYKEKNVSYVWAEYLNNDTVEDLTSLYTDLTNVTLQCVDENNNSLSDVTITIISHNLRRNPNRETFIPGQPKPKTNETGYCTFRIGGGNYTFKANSDKYTGELKHVKFSDDFPLHEFRITLKKKGG